MKQPSRTFLLCLFLTLIAAAAANGAGPKFHTASSTEPVIGRYLVTLDASADLNTAAATAAALARAYAGQLEPFASSDVRQFAITMLPARARTLSADPRVRDVVEIAQLDQTAVPPSPSTAAAGLARQHLIPVAQDSTASGDYLYDGSGNIKFIGSDSFTYDSVGRLKVATVQGNQQSYDYDAFGNRKSATRANFAVGCAGGTACEAVVTVLGQSNHLAKQTYDEAGNVKTGFGAAYTYDGTGMVTGATVGSDVRDFAYTASGERIAVRQGLSWTWTVRDQGNKVLREFTSLEAPSLPLALSAHTWSKDYIWRDGQLLASVFQTASGPTTYHYHLDQLGTPRLITGNGGVLVAKHAYYPFGTEMALTPTETTAELMKFTGHERDVVAGDNHSVDYMHARFYNAAMGRFLSVDPSSDLAAAITRPQRWNRFAYVRNNPINALDPDGRREARLYGRTINVEAGDVVILVGRADNRPKHVAIIAGFSGSSGGRLPDAMIYENVPVTARGRATKQDAPSAAHVPVATNSNSPDAGAGIWNASNTAIGGIVENRERVRLDHSTVFNVFSEQRVASAVAAVGPVTYNNQDPGALQPRCDCAGFVDQVLQKLGGTATGTEGDALGYSIKQFLDMSHEPTNK
jgi:RHS repeat-associated protein